VLCHIGEDLNIVIRFETKRQCERDLSHLAKAGIGESELPYDDPVNATRPTPWIASGIIMRVPLPPM